MCANRRRLPRRLLSGALSALLAAGGIPAALLLGCEPGDTLAPQSGALQYQQPGFVRVPGGLVDAAGGNLLIERIDLSIDTLLGTWEVRAVYDALSGAWLWDFQVRYDGETFLDPSGALHDLRGVADGAAIAGTVWVRVDADSIETRGGLGLHFDGQGRLDHVAWKSGDYPRIAYTWTASRLEMASCSQAAACLVFYRVDLDASGNPLAVVDERTARRAELGYDALGRLEVARSALDVAEDRPGTRYEYAGSGDLLSAVTSPEGERIEYAYQTGRRIRQVTQIGEGSPAHRFRFLARDGQGLYPTVHTNPVGGRTRYLFDAKRRLRRLERSDTGEIHSLAWSGLRPVRETAPGGVVTSLAWLDDELVSLAQPSGNVVRFSYAPGAVNLDEPFARAVARIEDDLGLVEERSYDPQGRLEHLANGEGETAGFERGPAALESFTSPAGLVWSFPLYGVHGHWLEVEGASRDRRAFDPVGNATATGAGTQEGGVLTRGYDADRNLTRLDVAATAAGSVLSQDAVNVAYRSDGRVEYVARPGGADHDFVYDALGRLAALREKVGGVWQTISFEYDAAGNPTARGRPNGMREEWERDAYGRVTRHRALRDGQLEGEAVTVWQDGRPASYSDSIRGTTEVYAYDAAGRLQTILFGFGETLTLEHDLRSRRTAEIYALPGQGTVRRLDYAYDRADRSVRVTADGAETLLELLYTGGRLDRTRYGNGLERDYRYDPQSGRLVATLTTDGAGQVVEDTAIVRAGRQDPIRFAVEVETTTSLATTREEYWLGVGGSLVDPDLRVGKRVWHWTDGDGASREFVYDALSNAIDNGSGDVFSYNPESNRLLQATLAATGETLAYTWDAAGFATSRGGLALTWTATGRLSSWDDVAIEWDLRGRPISIRAGGVARDFVFFGGAVGSDPGTGALGALDLGVVQLPFGSPARLYRHRDFRGNVSFVSDETGALRTHYQYSAYALEAAFGDVLDERSFAGRAAVGALMILGARIYDPAVGRFLSPDPVFQLLNPYTYTFGNPVSWWDPDGAHPTQAELRGAYQDAVEDLVAEAAFFTAAAVLAARYPGPRTFLSAVAAANRLKESHDEALRAQQAYFASLGADVGGAASGAAFGGASLPDFGSGPCRSRCTHPSNPGPDDGLPGAPQPSCAPSSLAALPRPGRLLAVLLPLQLALGLALLRRRSRGPEASP